MATIGTADKYDLIYFDKFGKYVFPEEHLDIHRNSAKLGILHKDTLIEVALANMSEGKYSRVAGQLDFSDESDAKTAVSHQRNNSKNKGQWVDSVPIARIKTKTGGLRIVAYHDFADEWYFLAIPYHAYAHITIIEIVFEQHSAIWEEPVWGFKPAGNKWLEYRVDTFEELALADVS